MATRNPWRPIALVLVATLSACGGQSTSSPAGAATPAGTGPGSESPAATVTPGTSGTPAAPPAFEDVFDIPDDPISVTPTLDEGRAVEATIPIEGGDLTASARDGTTYLLHVPSDALAADTAIRMTPVASLEGMPFGSDPHAVQLEPEGLHFVNYVTLTITPATPIPVDQQILFGYQGADRYLTLALPVVDSAPIAIRLLHFSGAGVTSGTAAQVAAAAPRIGADAEARITSAIAAELGRARQAALLGQEYEGDLAATDPLMQQYREQVVNPRVAAAGQSCAAGLLAIQTVLGFARQRALLGAAVDDEAPEMDPALFDLVAEQCVREEYERCRDQHVIQNMIPTWLGWLRTAALLGAADDANPYEAYSAYVRKCLVFEMKFESETTLSGAWDSAVRSSFELRYDTDALAFIGGESELVNFKFKFKASGGCTNASKPGGGTFHSIAFAFERDTRSPSDEVGYVRDIAFGYNPGPSSETIHLICPGKSYRQPNAGLWSGIFLNLHRGEGAVRDGSFTFLAEDWEIFGNAYYAKKEWIKSGDGSVEAGTLKLYHTPE